MGFNPRIAPYSIQMRCALMGTTTSGPHELDSFLHTMAFKGQVVGAYAGLDALAQAIASSDATTWFSVCAIWKEGEATTTGVYATDAMCAARETGEATADNLDGHWAKNRVYTLTNEVASRRTLEAGDKLYLRTRTQRDTTTYKNTKIIDEGLTIQVDYIYGLESA